MANSNPNQENLIKYKPGQCGNPNGRPKKIYTILKEKGYTSADIKASFGELAWYNEAEIKKIKNDRTKPMIVRIVANQFSLAYTNSDWSKVKEILEHTIGKATQPLELDNKTTKKDLSDIFPTDDELKKAEKE